MSEEKKPSAGKKVGTVVLILVAVFNGLCCLDSLFASNMVIGVPVFFAAVTSLCIYGVKKLNKNPKEKKSDE